MDIAYTIPCALDTRRFRTFLRDLGRRINYDSPEQAIALLSAPDRLSVERGWVGFPPWVNRAVLERADNTLTLTIELDQAVQPADLQRPMERLVADLSGFFGQPAQPNRKRVFGVGWPKSGTSSLTLAMRKLGFFSWRLAPWVIGQSNILSETPDGPPDLAAVAEYDFCADLPVSLLYRELDAAYPGSLFILTVRPVEEWLPVGLGAVSKDMANFGVLPGIVQWAYGTRTIDAELFRARYLRHQAEVLDYFAGRSDLLVIDLNDADAWPSLCEFVGVPVPDNPFELRFAWRDIQTAI